MRKWSAEMYYTAVIQARVVFVVFILEVGWLVMKAAAS